MCDITPEDLSPVLVRFCSETYPPPTDKESFFGKQIIIAKIVWEFLFKHHRGQVVELCDSEIKPEMLNDLD